jgi:hypothetical protein
MKILESQIIFVLLYFFFWPLYSLFFFDIRILIVPFGIFKLFLIVFGSKEAKGPKQEYHNRQRSPMAERQRSPMAERQRSPMAERQRSPLAERQRSPLAEWQRSPMAERQRSPMAEGEEL